MVAPVAAAAAAGGGEAAAAGAAARAAGTRAAASRGASSAGGRSAAASSRARNAKGQFVKADQGKEVTDGLGDIWQTLKKFDLNVLSHFKKMIAVGKKVFKVLEAASPALKQQMIVMRKSISLILRPIGDIMAKFLRPMAIWVMKFAQKWYSIFGSGSGEEGSRDALEDKKSQLEDQLKLAEAVGDEDKAKEIKDELDEVIKALDPSPLRNVWDIITGSLTGNVGKVAVALADLWEDNLKPAWEATKEWAGKMWDTLSSAWEGVKDWVGMIWNDYLVPAWTGVKEKIVKAWDGYVEWVGKLWTDYIEKPWKKVSSWLSSLWEDWVVTPFKKIAGWLHDTWDKYVTAPFKSWREKADSLWETIKSAFDKVVKKIKSWNPVKKVKDGVSSAYNWAKDKLGYATGGTIPETGMYQLHAGERVLNAGETSRMKADQSVSVTNNITIQASINNDLDINVLARKLARLQETELRRRVSYI